MYSSLTMTLCVGGGAELDIVRPLPRNAFTEAQLSDAAEAGYTLMYLETSQFVCELLDEYPSEYFADSLLAYRDAGCMRLRSSDSWYLVRVEHGPGPLIGGLRPRLLDAHETIHACLSYRVSAVKPLFGKEIITESVYVSPVQSPTHFNFPRICIDDAEIGIGLKLIQEQQRVFDVPGLYGIRALP